MPMQNQSRTIEDTIERSINPIISINKLTQSPERYETKKEANSLNRVPGSAFVKMSARLPAVGTLIGTTIRCSMAWLTKQSRISTCFSRFDMTELDTSSIAPELSSYMMVGSWRGRPISSRIDLNHIACCVALQNAITSASADDDETEDCFFEDQSTGPFVKNVLPA